MSPMSPEPTIYPFSNTISPSFNPSTNPVTVTGSHPTTEQPTGPPTNATFMMDTPLTDAPATANFWNSGKSELVCPYFSNQNIIIYNFRPICVYILWCDCLCLVIIDHNVDMLLL